MMRLGAGKIIPVAIALVTGGIFSFANADSYEMLLLSQLIIAIGACSGFVGAGYIGGQWFGMAKFSFMFGLVQFAVAFFSAFNQVLLGVAIERMPWRESQASSPSLAVKRAECPEAGLLRPKTGYAASRTDTASASFLAATSAFAAFLPARSDRTVGLDSLIDLNGLAAGMGGKRTLATGRICILQ